MFEYKSILAFILAQALVSVAVAQHTIALDKSQINTKRPLWYALAHTKNNTQYLKDCMREFKEFKRQRRRVIVPSNSKIVTIPYGTNNASNWRYELFMEDQGNREFESYLKELQSGGRVIKKHLAGAPARLNEIRAKVEQEINKGLNTLLHNGYDLPSELHIYAGGIIRMDKELTDEDKAKFYQYREKVVTTAFQRNAFCEPAPAIVMDASDTSNLQGIANKDISGHTRISMTIIHEMAHILHEQYAGRYFRQVRPEIVAKLSHAEQSEYPSEYPRVPSDTFVPYSLAVSGYSRKRNAEFVAELFTAVNLGKLNKLQPNSLLYYAELHGPPLSPLGVNLEEQVRDSLNGIENIPRYDSFKPIPLSDEYIQREELLELLTRLDSVAENVLDDQLGINHLARPAIKDALEAAAAEELQEKTNKQVAELLLGRIVFVAEQFTDIDHDKFRSDFTKAVSSMFAPPNSN